MPRLDPTRMARQRGINVIKKGHAQSQGACKQMIESRSTREPCAVNIDLVKSKKRLFLCKFLHSEIRWRVLLAVKGWIMGIIGNGHWWLGGLSTSSSKGFDSPLVNDERAGPITHPSIKYNFIENGCDLMGSSNPCRSQSACQANCYYLQKQRFQLWISCRAKFLIPQCKWLAQFSFFLVACHGIQDTIFFFFLVACHNFL